ncbi:MAG: hypothetical protein JWN23_743 [Rhodocyclales bacterium]|nr:hypothetical protein [Rhodocyclales bacterium]
MQSSSVWVGLVLLFTAISVSAQSEDPRPINRMAKTTEILLNARNYDELDRVAEQLRKHPQTLADGQPKLAGFYAGVSKCVQMRCGDEDFSEETWVKHAALLDEWSLKYPNSISAKLAKAMYMKEYAWYARGLGFSNTVSPLQWKLFDERIRKAHDLFDAVRQEGSSDPVWYSGMLSIALVEKWSSVEFEKLFVEGTTKFPYYLPLYFSKASYVSPRWGGTQQAFKKFVDDTVEATSKSMGETMYSRLNWSSWSSDMFSSGQTDWSRMKRGFTRLTHDYPDRWNINNFARFACLAGDATTLKAQLHKIGGSPIPEAWGNADFYFQCIELAHRPTMRQ